MLSLSQDKIEHCRTVFNSLLKTKNQKYINYADLKIGL